MKILDEKELNNNEYFVKTYTLDESIQVDSLIEIAKQFESEDIRLSKCHCRTFNENGDELYKNYHNIEEITQIKSAPSPYVDFTLEYCDTRTMEYRFSLLASTNVKKLTYVIDKKKIENNFQKSHGHINK